MFACLALLLAAACGDENGDGSDVDATPDIIDIADAEDGGDDVDAATDTDAATDGEDDAGDTDDPDADTGSDGDSDVETGDAPPDVPPADPFSFESGDATLAVDPAALTITLTWQDQPRFVLGADGIQLGVVARFLESKSYAPTGFFAPTAIVRRPDLDHWTQVARLDPIEDGIAITFDDGREAELAITETDGRFAFALTIADDGELPGDAVYTRIRPTVDETERFYGLGELFDQVEHRGTVRPMQFHGDELESAYNEAHVPVPFVIGTSGWGLFVATYRPGVFDVAAADPTKVDAVFGTGDERTVEFHAFADAHPLDVTRHYYEVTGYPARPARWALGPWIWRDENESEAQFRNDAQTIRDLDLATTALWIDRPYSTDVGAFDWDGRWTDAPAMIADARELGFRVALWSVPYLDEGADSTETLVQEAVESGYYPPTTSISLNNWGRLIDLTNPDAYDWWQDLVQRYVDDGIEGFKLDYAEDIILGPLGGRLFWEFHDGSDDRTMHARYQLFYHRVYAELLPEDGGFLLARGGTWGDQVNVSVIWPGDLGADFSRHREYIEDEDESYSSVGGIPAALIGGLSLGPSGFPLFGSDTGGYRHAPPDKETFTRWFQITALSPVMQVGTNTNDVPWEFEDDNGFDDEMLGWYRRYARLHLRLWPYVWTYLDRLQDDGRAIQRALGLAYPEAGRHPDDQFLLGDHLLAAPIVTRDARSRAIFFPEGEWVDWWTGERTTGPQEVADVAAPLDTLPLYVRAGAPVPLLRDTIDAMAPVTDPGLVDSYDTSPGVLFVRTTRGDETAFTLFDGAAVSQSTDGATTTLTWTAGEEFTLGARFELFGVDEPSGVTLGGEALGRDDDVDGWTDDTDAWTWTSERGGTALVQASGASAEAVVSFTE